jgi:hypothetical protein
VGFNISGAQPIPLQVIGGLVTEIAPTTLPEGCSPDNAEMMYLPGSGYSRSCFQKVFATPFAPGGPNGFVPTVVYAKSLVTYTGDIKNLYFDSNGVMWVEDWTNTPGSYTKLFTALPGSQCSSITCFGREYISINDMLHGAWPPLQYDGTNLDRLTQDGPGAPPSVISQALASSQMEALPTTLARNNNLVTANTATPHNLQVGYQAQISNIPDSNSTTVNQFNLPTVGNASGDWEYGSGQYRSINEPANTSLNDLNFSGCGFTIPSAATILGVTLQVHLTSQYNQPSYLSQVALWYEGASLGTIKTPNTPFPTSPTTFTYGSSGDDWGAALTPAIVNDPRFGFAVAANIGNSRVFVGVGSDVGGPYYVTVYYTLSGSGTVAFVQSIVIDNEMNPGLALVTTTEPHGLSPSEDVSIVGVEPGTVAAVTTAQWSSGITTITTAASHNLQPGSVIQISGVTTSTGSTSFNFDGTFTVETVPAPNQFTYPQSPITATDPDVIVSTGNTGDVQIAWPIPDNTPTPTYFEVQSCPTPTTFYVQVDYADGTWTTGTVGFIWEGTFFVTAVNSPTQFVYRQYGPNGSTSAIGTVTPFGQAAPGLHLCQVLFLDRQGGITAPSPPTTFIANGGQYVSVSNIPIGPSNIVARILAFTGAQPNVPGVLPPFFYLAVPAQLEGQVVSTGTQINDNTTTTALLDFSDDSLFGTASELGAISVTGNNLVNQLVLDGALAFGYFESRLSTIGQRATVQELLNMGFEGGSLSTNSTQPLGWTSSDAGILSNGLTGLGNAYTFTTNGSLSQSAYLDAYGNPIVDGNITYAARFLVQGLGANGILAVTLSSASTGFTSTANLAVPNGLAYVQANFSAVTPKQIPADMTITIAVEGLTAGTIAIDEASIFDSQNPYLDNETATSYTNNPAAFDGVSGVGQPTEDTHKIMGFSVIRSTPYAITQDPSGRVHQILVDPTSEPSGWEWKEIQSNCGTLSATGITHSQADDQTSSSGDDWSAWPTETGVGLFDGGQVHKVSQEIQPNWNPGTSKYPWMAEGTAINMDAASGISALCDPVDRMLYFFVPIGAATTPNAIYALSYRELNSASAIESSPPIHVSLGGKLVVTDNTRKWSIWNRPMNGAARMYRDSSGTLGTVFFGGNGSTAGTLPGFGNVYTLNPDLLTDDDYGQVYPYYVTFYGPDADKAQALQLTAFRKLLAYVTPFISGVGKVTYSILCDTPSNVWPLTATRTLTANPKFAQEFAGCQAQGSRMALKIASSPVNGTDNSFNLQWLNFYYRNAKLTIRGSAT